MRRHPSLLLVLIVVGSCGFQFDWSHTHVPSHSFSIGPAQDTPGSGEKHHLTIDRNRGGRAEAIAIAGIAWGRLADVYALDAGGTERTLVAADLVVGPELRSDGRSVELVTDPITAITSVTLLDPPGSSAFDATWARLESGLVPIEAKSLDPGELPPFPTVPRDAAIVVRFDDLIDPGTVAASSVQLRVGTPPLARFPARVLVDQNHGGWTEAASAGERRFLPTRVILDTTTSRAEALAGAATADPSPGGLPASASPGLANVALVLPTGAAGVRNLAGNGLAGPAEIVRAMRSGSDDDASRGLLADLTPPRVVGVQGVTIDAVAPDPQGGPLDFQASLAFATPACAHAVRPREVLVTLSSMAVVTRASAAPVAGQIVRVHARLIAGPPMTTGSAQLESVYSPAQDAGREACFVRFSPPPSAPPDAGVGTAASVVVRFSEPMDPATVSGLETLAITTAPPPAGPGDRISARASPNVFQDEFQLTPQVLLPHVAGTSETYFVDLASGPRGPRDLAGNPLRDALPPIPFHLDPAEATRHSGNYVLRFESADEDGNGHPEIRGQFLRDLAQGAILPRPVARFSAVADRTQPVPALMTPWPAGVTTPLAPLGSRLHAIWRYCDLGLDLLDESFTNVDVEGLAWSPAGGAVVADQYAQFEMSFAHAGFLPDEVVEPTSLLPAYPESGLVAPFARNQLDAAADPLRVVHPRQRGYTLNPTDAFVATTGTPMMPWPLNRNLPTSQFAYYTWRDTALEARGAPRGAGAELAIVVEATGSGTAGDPYPPEQVPTIGLPLLMEFKCFPDATALGLNALDASLAIHSSALPAFRAYSTGGTNSSGQTVTIDPDLATIAQGGFNPGSTPPGAPTQPIDDVFTLGQMDLVVRVSRVHSVWIDLGVPNASFVPPVLEPPAQAQPPGTQIVLAFRGATGTIPLVREDASSLDAYGDSDVPGAVAFLGGDSSWKSSTAELTGARFVQVRATFVSNAATGLTPLLTAMGLASFGP